MISIINGKLLEKNPTFVVIDINGLGYEIFISMQTFDSLPDINSNVTLFIQSIIREDSHSLFGFFSKKEREIFRKLIKVNGIGAKTALVILSSLSIDKLAFAIMDENIKTLSSIPGLGEKTAKRLSLELKDKIIVDEFKDDKIEATNYEDDITMTLCALGYNKKDALRAIKGLPKNINVSQGVKMALQNLIK